MGLAAFNAMRRRQAEREAAEAAELAQLKQDGANVPEEKKEPADDENETQKTPVNDEPTIDEVKAMLDDLNIKYAHNTGEEKLREKLNNAIK